MSTISTRGFREGDVVEILEGAYYTLYNAQYPIVGREGQIATVMSADPDGDGDVSVKVGDYDWVSLNPAGLRLLTDDPESVDLVNHPPHYTAYKGVEVIQLTEQMNFNRGNAVKYIARAGLKNPDNEVQDLEKALWYIQREIARITNNKEDAS